LAFGTARKAGRPRAPATRPSGALWGLPRAAQPPAWGDPSHPAPTGAGRGGGAHGHPILAVGQAAGPRLWAGYAHLSFWPSGPPPVLGLHPPGGGDPTFLGAPPAGVCPPAYGSGPCSPSTLHIRLTPRPVASSPRRRAR